MTLVDLQEYESREVALTSGDAVAIASTGVVEVKPAWTAGHYQLRAGPVIGTLPIGDDLLLRVTPKVSIRRVVYLLCHAAGLATWDDTLVDLDAESAIDLAIAHAFVTAAERAPRRGPRSAYTRWRST
jgi:5-methylcytosine-specific restriction enzyme subunit McrC